MPVRTWTIGVFIVAGLSIFTAFLFLIGDRQKAFSRHLELYTHFSNLGGLANGAKVRVSGLDAGKLKKIEVPSSPSSNFRLELEVEERVKGLIRQDSVVSIETDGVVGDKYIGIRKGTDRTGEVHNGSNLPSKEPLDLGALLENGSGLLQDVHSSVKDIRGRVDGALDSITKTVNHADNMVVSLRPDLRHMAADGTAITGNVKTLTADLNSGKGPAGLLLKDEATKQQLQQTLSNVQQATDSLNQSSNRIQDTIADFQARNLVAKTDATLDNVKSISQELDSGVKQALAEDTIGQNGGANLRETLSNLNRSTANLADDTEALKRNFFFRGFFKQRGFYSMDQLTPVEYTKACERQKNAGTRKWFEASELLNTDSNGGTVLSDAGRLRINNDLAPLSVSLPGQLVVVEGYSRVGSQDVQFTQSRERAELVRRYLESHYHLKHSNVGIVAMGDQPPDNAGRDRWDGVAVMVLKMKGR